MTINISRKNRATAEDYARAVGYAVLMAWSVLFLLFPPVAFVSELDMRTRVFWMLFTFIGAAMAFLGAVLHIDLKLEMPGIALALVGPLFYCLSQLYYVLVPSEAVPDPTQRIALVAYAMLPVPFMISAAIRFFIESRRLKRINMVNTANIPLTAAESRQPGAFGRKGGK